MSPLEKKEFRGPSNLTAMDRRDFMKYMGLFSSMTLLSNCSKQADHIVPYSKEIQEFSHTNYEYYASAISVQGLAQGITAKSFQGRPIKIEGLQTHAYSQGTTTPQAQGTLYDLYHPERIKGISWKNESLTIKNLRDRLVHELKEKFQGEGVAFCLRPELSPTLVETIDRLKEQFPKAIWTSTSPYQRNEISLFDLSSADLVVSFDEDLFYGRVDALKNANDFMDRKIKAIRAESKPNAIVMEESSPTLLGAKADDLKVLNPIEIWNDACDLYDLLEGRSSANPRMEALKVRLMQGQRTVVAIGRHLSSEASDLEALINQKLQGPYQRNQLPKVLTHTISDLKNLVNAGKIKTLISLGDDVFQHDIDPKKISCNISLGMFPTKTSESSDVVIGESHFLESWGDLLDPAGDVLLVQPLIRPLHLSMSQLEFLSLLDLSERPVFDLLKTKYASQWESLQKGIPIKGQLKPSTLSKVSFKRRASSPSKMTLKLMPDPSIGYGEHANNPVLQELPKLFSKITWQNALLISPKTSVILKVKDGDKVQIKSKGQTLTAPVKILPGVADSVVVGTLGYGDDHGTFVKRKRGHSFRGFTQFDEIVIEKVRGEAVLAMTQETLFTPGQEPVKQTRLPLTKSLLEKHPSLYPENPLPHEEKGPQWGMTIDLTSCIGCQACVVSCQVENNIPFVGEDQVAKGRILHWLRIDTYRIDEKTFFQPVPCMHCEKAPCEVVCPVNATLHGNGGLNEMVYQRCVGTRYCSNNCPYKVRHFNFGSYSSIKAPWSMGFNPEVSVRDRGVMEKCTYCIQRLKVNAGEEAPKTACQTVCPTKSIEFGNIRDPKSQVAINKASPLNYDLLEEEGTLPRTSYLKVVRL